MAITKKNVANNARISGTKNGTNHDKNRNNNDNNDDSKTVDRLISSMRNGDGDVFQRRRNSLSNSKDDRKSSPGNIEESLAALREKVGSKFESDEDSDDSTDDDDWD